MLLLRYRLHHTWSEALKILPGSLWLITSAKNELCTILRIQRVSLGKSVPALGIAHSLDRKAHLHLSRLTNIAEWVLTGLATMQPGKSISPGRTNPKVTAHQSSTILKPLRNSA